MTQFTQETASDSIARFNTLDAISAKLTTAVLLQMDNAVITQHANSRPGDVVAVQRLTRGSNHDHRPAKESFHASGITHPQRATRDHHPPRPRRPQGSGK